MYRRKEVQSEWGFIGDVLKIALGVFIGSMAAVFTYEGVLVWRAEQASRQVMKEFKALEEKQKLAQQQRLQQEKEQKERQHRQQEEREQQRQQQRQQQVLAARKKEQAWSNFFQPSYTCRVDPSRGDCADMHIRARTAFEAQYRD